MSSVDVDDVLISNTEGGARKARGKALCVNQEGARGVAQAGLCIDNEWEDWSTSDNLTSLVLDGDSATGKAVRHKHPRFFTNTLDL